MGTTRSRKVSLWHGRLAAAGLATGALGPLVAAAASNPCVGLEDHVEATCKAAGYYLGGSTVGKGLQFDCRDLVLAGSQVEGLPADSLTSACVKAEAMQACHVDGTRTSPCDEVLQACRASGYSEGGFTEGKGLWWDCVIPVLQGALPTVPVKAELVSACLNDPSTLLLRDQHPPEHARPIAGIPDAPDQVAVVPFYSKKDETPLEKTKVILEAEVDGIRGLFILDTGAPVLNLNRTFLQPHAGGGVELVTAANRQLERLADDGVHVALRLGSLSDTPADQSMPGRLHRPFNAELSHQWGNYTWVFAPRIGNLSLSALEPFETIIDYTHRRVVFIRLDSAGKRMVPVPAYVPRWSTPLIDQPRQNEGLTWWAVAVTPDGVLDTKHPAKNTERRMFDTGDPTNHDDVLGYPFLSELGVVGLNHRTHEFILYR